MRGAATAQRPYLTKTHSAPAISITIPAIIDIVQPPGISI